MNFLFLGITNFTAHTGWLSRFEKKFYLLRYNKCKNCQNNKAMDAKNEEKLVADELAGKLFASFFDFTLLICI